MPPYIHCVNAAERAIRTWKYHFIAGLVSTDTCFPMHLCCGLIPQATMTLNMLRPCQLNPTMSAHTAIEGKFEFLKTPLVPIVIKVAVHTKNRNSVKLWEYMEYQDVTLE